MIMFPDVQKKAQAELDSVIGTSRLPTMEDRSKLPYIDACMKEVLRYVLLLFYLLILTRRFERWNPIGPLGMYNILFNQIASAQQSCRYPAPCHGERCIQRLFHSQRINRSYQHMV